MAEVIVSEGKVVEVITTVGLPGPIGPNGPPGPPGVDGTSTLPGPQGPEGPQGPGGPQGPQGDPGTNGSSGSAGTPGSTGAQGPKGDPGATGGLGRQGLQGTIGPEGPQGVKGDTGSTGSVGIQGDIGPQGPAGMSGMLYRGVWSNVTSYATNNAVTKNGAVWFATAPNTNINPNPVGDGVTPAAPWVLFVPTGTQGAQGIQGIQGIKGDVGNTGSIGLQGITGPQGVKGDVGNPGSAGSTGPQGVKGDIGTTGTQGVKGDPGTTGSTGQQGIQGPKGDIGLTGPQGVKGDPGSSSSLPTKRSTEVFTDTSFNNPSAAYSDTCARMGFTLPVAPPRCRFKIRNLSTMTGHVSVAPVSGITYVGALATVTAPNHGKINGQSTTFLNILSTGGAVAGTLQTLVNGLSFVVSNVTTNTFQVTLAATPSDAWMFFLNQPVCTNPQPISFTGIWWGTPNVANEATWLGDFTAAPTALNLGTGGVSDFIVDPNVIGEEWVSPWFTPPVSANTPYSPQGISFGFTTPAGVNVYLGQNGLSWHSATVVGCSTAASAAVIPTVGILDTSFPFDVRMEYEYVGNNQIGLFLSTSLGDGSIIPTGTKKTFGLQGPGNTWPKKAGMLLGHAIINGAIGGASTGNFLDSTKWPTARFDLATTIPDYAVIDLIYNDAGGETSLAIYQTNVLRIIANLKVIGIKRIYICTGWGGGGYNPFGSLSFVQGALNADLSAGSKTQIIMQNPGKAVAIQGLPGGGWPGATQQWTGAASGVAGSLSAFYIGIPESGTADGPFAPGAITATATATTMTLGTFGTAPILTKQHYAGEVVMGSCEFLRRAYNYWIRQGVPGTVASFDMDELAWDTVSEPRYLNGKYFANANTGPHPSDPGLYSKMAQTFSAGLSGN